MLYDKGMTIAGVKKILHNGEFSEIQNESKPQTIIVQKSEPSTIDNASIDAAIELLNQAKKFLI